LMWVGVNGAAGSVPVWSRPRGCGADSRAERRILWSK